ncbi:hypothetical protein [Brevibacterium aurantiacum]|uniref:Uncharacterized protein n=1 Tax=Brevibacterium aurantiacum TaxID=273384 RepID=A0A556C613_BREAU|nr:hypothetical protein [Brevibacterium aurantiacum]TSI12830.1 hypothetical protein FO013_18765 [Brevibacterium aurantiacum]
MSDDIEVLFGPWIVRQKLDHFWVVNVAIHQKNSQVWGSTLDDLIIDIVPTTTPALEAAVYDLSYLEDGSGRSH